MTRALLVLACVAVLLLVLFGMRVGWRNRLGRQADLPALPDVPAELGPAAVEAGGVYVGSTYASSWQDRVIVGGLGVRAAAALSVRPAGLLFDRDGAEPIFVPVSAWVQARLAPGLAGKVMGEGGLFVLRWRLGDAEVDSAFRADDKTIYPALVEAVNTKAATA
ncbi:transporter [uncultured Jatrophihabitans sp.]|uniref:PH-like domain-containing protein n=1 Tax=uncultured Jatrophihabitans sp. TaxID=1610747 RepID=UPI0035CC9F34